MSANPWWSGFVALHSYDKFNEIDFILRCVPVPFVIPITVSMNRIIRNIAEEEIPFGREILPILISNVEKVTFHLLMTIFRQIFDAFEKDSHLCRRFTVFVTKYNLMSKVSASLLILIARSR
jgi:hypothetical protein